MTFIRVRNFEKFQHYKHRNPPWIRLYFELLGDKDFYNLSAKLKFQIIGLFLLASKCDNKIAADPKWIQSRIHSVEPINIQDLIKTTFIETCEDASKLLATCVQDASNLRTNHVSETDSSDNSETDSSETEGTETRPYAFGEFENVLLTPDEHGKLISKLGNDGAAYWIEELSRAIASKGLKYKSHYATILTWERNGENKREYKNKQDRNAEAARRLLSRLDSQNRGGGNSGIAGSEPTGLLRAITAPVGPRDPNRGNPNN